MSDTLSANDLLIAGSSRKPDSKWIPRISVTQRESIERALTGRKLNRDMLAKYVETGDLSAIDDTTRLQLRAIVKQAKEGLNASQAKRIWPRKVAAVALDQQ